MRKIVLALLVTAALRLQRWKLLGLVGLHPRGRVRPEWWRLEFGGRRLCILPAWWRSLSTNGQSLLFCVPPAAHAGEAGLRGELSNG